MSSSRRPRLWHRRGGPAVSGRAPRHGRARAWLLAVAAALAALAGHARGISPATVDPFLAYKTKPTKHTAKFAVVPGVHLVDAFEDLSFDLKTAGDLLVPADVGGVAAVDRDTHLRAYKLKT